MPNRDRIMATALHFQNESMVKDLLARQLRRGRLAILIGSGISRAFGLPDWEELIDRMFAAEGTVRPTDMTDLTMAAELLEKTNYNDLYADFLTSIHTALYLKANVTFRELRKSDVLAAVGALAIASRRGSAAVVIYNFYDILEQYLRYHGFEIHSVITDRHWAGPSDVTVYHPHGFLPFSEKDARSERVVITRQDYNRIVGQDGDLWRQLLRTTLRTRMCLFLGLGVRDTAIDSLIDKVKADHAANGEFPYWGFAFTTAERPADEPLWNARGIHIEHVPDYEEGLANYLFEICQRAAAME
jgi:hypothetical protein